MGVTRQRWTQPNTPNRFLSSTDRAAEDKSRRADLRGIRIPSLRGSDYEASVYESSRFKTDRPFKVGRAEALIAVSDNQVRERP